MNTFYETVNERKALNASARHRVNGSRSKRCTFPSDNLTAAQRKKLNGPCASYSMREPITWAEYKKMPTDLQERYIANLQDTFNVSCAAICRVVFGISTQSFTNYARNHGIVYASKRKPTMAAEAKLTAWAEGEYNPWAAEDTEGSGSPEASDTNKNDATEPEPDTVPNPEPRSSFVLSSCTFTLTGDYSSVADALRAVMGGMSGEVEVNIKFN